MNIEQYRKRFYNLMESELGNVKPLINEGDETVDGAKITQLTIVDGYSGSTVTLSNNKTYNFGGPPEPTYMAPNHFCTTGKYDVNNPMPNTCIVLITINGEDYNCDINGCRKGVPDGTQVEKLKNNKVGNNQSQSQTSPPKGY